MTKSARIPTAVLAIFAIASVTQAQSLNGGSNIISVSDVSQLGTWLGEGPLQLTRIYTETSGHTSADFHAAVDGQGRTFAIMEVSNVNGQTMVVGGYNPTSWLSAPIGWSLAPNPGDRKAFLFNLTTGVMQAERLDDAAGQYIAYNSPSYGPNFGSSDIYVGSNLTAGFATRASYGSSSLNIFGLSGTTSFSPAKIEVFTIAPDPVPEPTAGIVLTVGVIMAVRRRRVRATR